ncbi:MAG: lipopolysaccharide biosynthesis protein [Gammaproteobacteria bacterium]|nr:lipopolysaccharide biosynthesis protein [Gammaproteobacteria bacterium]MBU1483028.1 lipopolysaccharide biosynthesis protein [Gammaproteobacteria bacterium]
MATEYELTLSDYLSILRRRAPYLIGIFSAVLLIAVAVAFTLPPSYMATGTIMVETPQVLDGVIPRANRNNLDERIDVIKQRAMTREGLLQIINKYTLFKDNSGTRTTTELIDMMRSRVTVESLGSGQQGQSATAFTISFEDQKPEVALQVTNDLVTLFLDWNIKLRTEGATETTEFLSQESDKLKAEVDRLEEKISAYKRQNSNNLPEQLSLRTTMMARAENDLYSVERDIRSGNEELRSLEAELSVAGHGISNDSTQTLPALRAEYTRLSAVYTESHPDLRAIKRKIDALEQGLSAPVSGNTAGNVTNLAVFTIQAKIDAVKARMESLAQQKKMLQDKISENEHAMVLTPRVAQGLDILIRDRDSAQRKFDELRNKKMNAQIAQNLESENKSERFTLLEPPILPEKPFKPNRKKIFALGLFLALASALGVVMLLESIDKRIRGAEALTHAMGFRPLVIIPYLPVEGEQGLYKNKNMREIIAMLRARWKI